MTIYVDGDYKCYVSKADGRRAIETNYFDGKCTEWIESFRYVPAGETWARGDGEVFTDMTAPWKDMANAYAAQITYITHELVTAQEEIAKLDSVLLDAEYKNIIGEETNE